MIVSAENEFYKAMTDSENLIDIHKELNREAGLRVREMSLNRAVVVLTVAAWQAYVQDLVTETLKVFEIPPGDHARAVYVAVRADVLSAADKFSTPNSDNTR